MVPMLIQVTGSGPNLCVGDAKKRPRERVLIFALRQIRILAAQPVWFFAVRPSSDGTGSIRSGN